MSDGLLLWTEQRNSVAAKATVRELLNAMLKRIMSHTRTMPRRASRAEALAVGLGCDIVRLR
jgi:hypothetical protein